MKVLQVNKLYYPWIGGVEKVVQSISEGLNDKTDLNVLVCRSKGRRTQDAVNGVSVTRASSLGIFFSMPLSLNFPFLLKRLSRNVDVLHFHLPFPLAVISYFLMRPKGKLVLWWHSDIVRQKKIMFFYKPLLRRFLKRADRIIVASSEQMNNSEHLHDFREKCDVIPFGIDTRGSDPDGDIESKVKEIRSEYGPNVVLFVGRLIYYKGVEYLIRAMKDVDGRLLLIGEGPLENRLRSQVMEFGVESKVTFLGKVQDRDMPAYYRSCDVFVLPSIARSEAFGVVQLEAMAFGKPVVNTDLPTGVPRISRDGETGITVPPADSQALSKAISKLLTDSDFSQTCGSNARRRVEEHFSMCRMIDNVYRVYQKVLE